jgi:GMP synthase-like glutamine amidotransferase
LPRRILAIQNSPYETLGTLEPLFKSDGFEINVIEGQSDPIPSSPGECAALVILGGPMAVYDNLPYLQNQQVLIKNAMQMDVPILGICLGSQLIAQSAGGRVFKGPRKEIGWYNVFVTPASSNDIFRGITEKTINVFQWHGDTYELPPKAKILAYSETYPQAFRIGSAVGIQFHLEVDELMIKSWIDKYRSELAAEKIESENILPLNGSSNMHELFSVCKLVYRNFTKSILT